MKFVRLSSRSLQICGATLLMLSACSSSDAPKDSAGNSGSGGSSIGGGSSGAPATSSGGKSGVAGSGGSTLSSGSGGAGNSAGSSSTIGPGGSSAGGAVSNGGALATTGGGGGGGAAGASTSGGACTRDFLKSTLAAYFTALAAHSSAGLPLADSVKVTENGKTIMVGDGLWKTAGMVKYNKSALDTDGCNTATEAVVPEGSTDLPVALRLKFVAQKITEIETIAVRAGDYKVSGSNYPSKPDAIIMSDATIMWESPVPEAMRNTPKEMNAWMSKYFKAFPAGVCNADTNCKRLENGNSPGGCNLGASCQAAEPTGNVIKSHAIFADAETGIGVGFDFFMGNADMHMFKMYGGKVYAVHAVLGTATSTGWNDM